MSYLKLLQDVLKLEADCLLNASNKLNEEQAEALKNLFEALLSNGGNLIFIGVGKSGQIAQKLAATFSSLGLPSFFLHPTEALHGDLGRVKESDAAVLISKSGTTEEISKLLPFLKIKKDRLIGLIGAEGSPLAENVGIFLNCSVEREACLNNQAPTTSSTLALAMGDAMAVLFEKISGLSREGFAVNHPGGLLGKSLRMKVNDLMWPKEKCPVVTSDESLKTILLKMTNDPVGGCAIVDAKGKLEGLMVEGDIRRFFASGKEDLNTKASEIMTKSPLHIETNQLAFEALEVMEKRDNPVSILPVLDKGTFLGMVRLHDLLKEGFISSKN